MNRTEYRGKPRYSYDSGQVPRQSDSRDHFHGDARISPVFDLAQAKADDLRKASYVVVTNGQDVVVASVPLAQLGGTEHVTLAISLPDDLVCAPLALHSKVLVERMNAAFSRGETVLAWAINGPGCSQMGKYREEFALCRAANAEQSVFCAFLAVGANEVASASSFEDALRVQLRILAEEIINFRDPLSKQSSAGSTNKEIHNDRIEQFISKVRKHTQALLKFHPY
jgi:hypothetical protein